MLRTALIAAALLFTGPVPAVAEPVGDRVEVNGMQMYYEVSGQGDPVIVLHGSYMNIPSMGAIIPKLAETHKVYALELQGHGRTTDIDRPITYANLADDVGVFDGQGGPQEGRYVRLFDGRRRRAAARHPTSGQGEQAHLGVGGLRRRRLAAGVQGFHPADERRDVRQHAVRRGVQEARPQSGRLSRPGPEADCAREGADRVAGGREGHEDPRADDHLGDADWTTLEHSVALFRLLGGGVMGDMGKPLPASRLAVLPATSHTAVITQTDLLLAFVEPFLKGETPKGMFE